MAGETSASGIEQGVGESNLSVWDPMKEDFKNVNFNCYNSGPGARLPMWAQPANRVENEIPNIQTNSSVVKSCNIFVNHIPLGMTEEALKKLFSKSGDVLYVKMCRKHGSIPSAYGFVTLSRLNEAMDAIRRFNHFHIGSSVLHVSFSCHENHRNNLQAILGQTKDTALPFYGNAMTASNTRSGAARKLDKADNATVEPKASQEVQIVANAQTAHSVAKMELNDLRAQFVQQDSIIECMVTEWQDPERFYVQQLTVETANGLKELLTLCQGPNMVGGPPAWPGYQPGRGEVCTACYSKDGVWYRVVASEVDRVRGFVRAFFLDYGSWEDIAFENVRPPLEEFRKHPPYAMQCQLAGVRLGSCSWNDYAPQLQASLLNQLCMVRVEGYDKVTRMYMVDLDLPGTGCSLRASLLEKGICVAGLNNNCIPATGTDTAKGILRGQPARPAADTRAFGDVEKASAVGAEVSAGAALEKDVTANLPNKGDSFRAVVGDLVNPGLFFCQRTEFAEELAKVMATLACLGANSVPSRVSPYVGQVVSAQHSGDNLWYRALILHVENEHTVNVCYVDFGNCETLPVSRLRAIPPELLKLPSQALRCCLFGVRPLSDAWSVEATGLLSKLVKGEILNARVVVRDSHMAMLHVKLSPMNFPVYDLSELLINYQVAKPALPASGEVLQPSSDAQSTSSPILTDSVKFPVGAQVHVMVTEVQSPGHFYCIQLIDNDIQALKQVLVEVAAYCERTEPQPDFLPDPGQLCCARYSNDGVWYRARVLARNGGLVHVQYLDYGNSEEVGVQDLRPLNKDSRLLQWPFMAFRCSLVGVRPINSDSWSTESTKALLKLTSNRPLWATVMAPWTGDTVPVHLRDDATAQQEALSDAAPDACTNLANQLVRMGLATLAAEPCDVQEEQKSAVEVSDIQCGSDFDSSASSVLPTDAPSSPHPNTVAEGPIATPASGEPERRVAADPLAETATVLERFVVRNDQLVLDREELSEILTEVTEAVNMLELLTEAKKKLEHVGKLIQQALEKRQ